MTSGKTTIVKKKEFITIKVAADILDSSPSTLRHWDKIGKLCAIRSRNSYRLYRTKDILKFLRQHTELIKIKTKKLLGA